MRLIIQRVSQANVVVNSKQVANISKGLLIFLGVCEEDTEDDINWLIRKVIHMRIFSDLEDKMNLSLIDVNGAIIVVSQFTLYASTKKGNRPSFIKSATPDKATILYKEFINKLKENNIETQAGVFGADMKVSLLNDGPVTIMLDSKNRE